MSFCSVISSALSLTRQRRIVRDEAALGELHIVNIRRRGGLAEN
jgi:hypothetical protein